MKELLAPFSLKPRKPREENPYADIYARALAACVDVILLFFIYFDFFNWMDQRYFLQIDANFFQHLAGTHDVAQRAELMTQWLTRSLMQFLLFGIAIVGVQMLWGTTPGKWLIGLKIVRHKTHEPISRWRFVLRFLAYVPACLPLMLGVIWASFNKERRGWHDYIAGTVVLNLRPRSWYWRQAKRLSRRIRGKSALEQPVGEPAPAQRHEDGGKPVE